MFNNMQHPNKRVKNPKVVKRKIRTLVRSEEISFCAEDVLTADGLATIMLKHEGHEGT